MQFGNGNDSKPAGDKEQAPGKGEFEKPKPQEEGSNPPSEQVAKQEAPAEENQAMQGDVTVMSTTLAKGMLALFNSLEQSGAYPASVVADVGKILAAFGMVVKEINAPTPGIGMAPPPTASQANPSGMAPGATEMSPAHPPVG